MYEPPFDNPKAPVQGFSPRGMDVDRNGVVWAALASGHMACFDRRKCKGPLNGPTATGQHCPEGWTLYTEPLPQMKGVTDSGSAEASYYTWVDQFDTFGLGRNVPINTGNASEGLLVLKDGKWIVLRVPYPLGLLHEVAGRPDRRCQGGMEGPRALVHGQHARAVPHGGRQGDDEQGREVPAPAGPPGEVDRTKGASGVRLSAAHFRVMGSGSLSKSEVAMRRLGLPTRMVLCLAGAAGIAGLAQADSAKRPPQLIVQKAEADLAAGTLAMKDRTSPAGTKPTSP